MAVNVGQAVGYLDLDTSGFQRGFKSALTDLKGFIDNTNSLGSRLTSLGSAMTTAGSTMTKHLTVPIAAVGTAAVVTAAQFESAMSEVQAISGVTGQDFDALVDKAKEMGATTKFSASESAEGLKYMAMAGWDAQQMLDGLPGVMLLAAASGEELGTVSDIVTDAMTAFGLEANQAAHFADVLAVAASSSNTNVGMLGESFKYVAPLAGTLGYSIEDVGVALGLMANRGIKASQAGTSMRSMLTNLIKPTDQMQASMDELGISIVNTDGTMKDFDDVMLILRDAFSGLTEEEKAFHAATIAGQRGMSSLLAITEASNEEFYSLTNALNTADGAAQSMADTMMDNLSGQITILKSTLEGIAISFGDILLPAIKSVTQGLQNFLTWLNNLDEGQKRTIVTVAAVVAAIGPILLIVGKVVTVVGTLLPLITKLKTGIALLNAAMLANPALAVAAGIAVLVAGIVTLVAWLNRESEEQKKLKARTEAVIDANNALIKSVEDSQKAYEDKTSSLIAESAATQTLADRVYNLAEQENKSEEDKRKLKVMVDLLNESMGDTVVLYDAETDAISKTREEVNNLIASRREEILAQAAQERAVEIAKEMAAAEEQLNSITRQRVELELAKADGVYDGWAGSRRYEEQERNLLEAEEELNNTLGELSESFDYQTEKMVETAEASSTAAQAMATEWVAANGEIMASQDDMIKKNEDLQKAMGDYVNAVTDMFNEVNEKAKGTTEEYLATLDHNYEASQRYTENLATLMDRGLDEAIVQQWREKGLESAGEVALWANATDEEILALNEKMARNLEEGTTAAAEVMQVGGADVVSGLVDGINDNIGLAEQAGEDLANATVDASLGAFDINSPSGVYLDIADNIMDTLSDRVRERSSEAADAMMTVAEAMVKPFDEIPTMIGTKMSELMVSITTSTQHLQETMSAGSNVSVTLAVQQFQRLPIETKVQLDLTQQYTSAWSTSMKNLAQTSSTAFVTTIVNEIKKLPTEFQTYYTQVLDYLNSLPPQFATSGRNQMNALFTEIKSVGAEISSWVTNWANNIQRTIDRMISALEDAKEATRSARSSSHAAGLDYVPHNGYQATLHEGERVLTAEENKRYPDGDATGGDTFIFNSPTKLSPAEAAREMKQAKAEMALNFR